MRLVLSQLTLMLLLTGFLSPAWGLDYRGEASVEARYFASSAAQDRDQGRLYPAIQLGVEFWHSGNRGRDLLTFAPYLRLDARDSERNLADIRELSWIHVGNFYELRTGIRQVYWGVTEGADLVNIINQTDGADGPDSDRTLGQPMVNLALEQGNHMLDLFLLIGARERTFPGEDGRLRLPVVAARGRAESIWRPAGSGIITLWCWASPGFPAQPGNQSWS